MGWTNEQIHLLKRFNNAIKSDNSMRYEFEKDENGYIKYPTVTHRVFHEYTNIGNNVELDSYGMLVREDEKESYVFFYPHIRNTVKVDESFLATLLSTIRQFILNKITENGITIEDIHNLPPNLRCQIPTVTIDPGLKNHNDSQPRNAGVRIGALSIWYNRFNSNAEVLLQEGLNVRKLLLEPESYYNDLICPDVDMINKLLSQVSAQRFKPKRLQIKSDLLINSPGKFSLSSERIQGYPNEKHEIVGTYEFVGDAPPLKYDVVHDPEEKGLVRADWTYHSNTHRKEQGHFVIHLPKYLEQYASGDKLDQVVTENNILHDFKQHINNKFSKHDISTNWYVVDSPKLVYDI